MIYSEGSYCAKFYYSIIRNFDANLKVLLISNSDNDQTLTMLRDEVCQVSVVYTKSADILKYIFQNLRCSVFLTTIPDLSLSFFKKTDLCARYVYIPHSLVSTHVVYNERAFDDFDCIFVCGEYQKREIRKREALFNLPQKKLIPLRFPLFDWFDYKYDVTSTHRDQKSILIAPSWGAGSFFETQNWQIWCEEIIAAGYKVILRPHPETIKRNKQVALSLENYSATHKKVLLDLSPDNFESLSTSTYIITDWSGISLDFALYFERPVILIDGPRKINNPNFNVLEIEAMEEFIRNSLFPVISLSQFNEGFLSQLSIKIKDINDLRGSILFNNSFNQQLKKENLLDFFR